MAFFQSFSKLRAVVPELQILKGPVLYRNSTQQLCAHLASTTTHRHRNQHQVVTDDTLILSCMRWGCNTSSRRGFQTCGHLNNEPLKQYSKIGSGSGSELKTKQEIAALASEENSLSAIGTSSKIANKSGEANQDGCMEDEERDEDGEDEPLIAKYDEMGKPLSNWMRMKMMMKAYGYVIIPVHWIIAPMWFGAFYYTVKMGVDIAPLLLKVGITEHYVNTLNNSGASNALMAYALYKIFSPLRYTVTLGATEMTIRYLRRKGYIRHAPRKEKSYRQSLKETVKGVKDKIDNR